MTILDELCETYRSAALYDDTDAQTIVFFSLLHVRLWRYAADLLNYIIFCKKAYPDVLVYSLRQAGLEVICADVDISAVPSVRVGRLADILSECHESVLGVLRAESQVEFFFEVENLAGALSGYRETLDGPATLTADEYSEIVERMGLALIFYHAMSDRQAIGDSRLDDVHAEAHPTIFWYLVRMKQCIDDCIFPKRGASARQSTTMAQELPTMNGSDCFSMENR
jgi:hypothetical protein